MRTGLAPSRRQAGLARALAARTGVEEQIATISATAGVRIPACREYSARPTQDTSHDHCAVCRSPPAQQPTALSY
ncbi:hypothetical protein [Streptomyces sp. NPDC006510]|uniref:hypothetical protein n=1 Tax=Streptomyces sp. NPDC006510 TaxID=3155600 RepID=UPI0033A52C13